MKISATIAVCLSMLAAHGCAKVSVLGTSAEPGGAEPAPPSDPQTTTPTQPPAQDEVKLPSVISATPDVEMIMGHPILGDVDGDGFDDFFVQAVVTTDASPDLSGYGSNVYLYYGRPLFPQQLSTLDADAVFTGEQSFSSPLGDINGDGLSDFSIGTRAGPVIIFGDKTRYSGTRRVRDAGVMFRGKPVPYQGEEIATLNFLRPAGDVNGDGFDDLIVNGLDVQDRDNFVSRDYLVLGHAGEWAVDDYDPRSAAAVFDLAEHITRGVLSAGDLDGDGYSDLFAPTEQYTFVYYGGPQFSGNFGMDRADAKFSMSSGCRPYVVGDLDGDGRTDLAACSGGTIDFVYGSKTRFSGEYTASADFSIEISEVGGSLLSAAAGDVDSDDSPDLVVSAIRYSETAPEELATLRFVYAIRGTGTRRTGIHTLSSTEGALGPAYDLGVITPRDLATRAEESPLLSVAGDLDGDGSDDILTEGSHGALPESGAAVTLIPSTPRIPD